MAAPLTRAEFEADCAKEARSLGVDPSFVPYWQIYMDVMWAAYENVFTLVDAVVSSRDLDKAFVPTERKCTCPMQTIMMRGCQCGGY